jgi:HEPN superfamily RiboL-PSP-like protein
VMRFGQLEQEIKQCEQYLDETNSKNTQLENYLVRYLLVRICAEYETRISTLVQRRCSRINDPHVLNFANVSACKATQRFNIGDLTGMLGSFGEDYKQAFQCGVHSQPHHAAWDNIYNNRHTVAHGNGNVMMTFKDLKKDYATSMIVIDKLVQALCLRPKDIKGLK